MTSHSKGLIITIDGPAGVGKSTAAKLLAKRLRLTYLDTGATYRAFAYAALTKGIDLRDVRQLANLARSLKLTMHSAPRGGMVVRVSGRDVTRQIRTERVSEAAAVIAQYPVVRTQMVQLQRRLAQQQPIVAEGRDTGSVVFPHASYKFFLTANAKVRAKRRHTELRQVEQHPPMLTQIAKQLEERDRRDRTRKIGPLVRPDGAMVLDTSRLKASQVVQHMLRCLEMHQLVDQARSRPADVGHR